MVPQVAKLIIQVHKASNECIGRIVQTTNVKPDESFLSTGLRTQDKEIAENIANLSGQEFHCTYLQKQIEQHELVLRTVREQLITSTSQHQVQELLTIAEPKLEAHLKTAKGHRAHLQCLQVYAMKASTIKEGSAISYSISEGPTTAYKVN